jgi:hypothetical protein
MKYAVVYWIATNETSCFGRQLDSRCQHSHKSGDERSKGMIYYRLPGEKKAPKGDWKDYIARVVSVHGKLLYYTILLYKV